MACLENNNTLSETTEILFNEGMNGLDTAISILINEAMQIECQQAFKSGTIRKKQRLLNITSQKYTKKAPKLTE